MILKKHEKIVREKIEVEKATENNDPNPSTEQLEQKMDPVAEGDIGGVEEVSMRGESGDKVAVEVETDVIRVVNERETEIEHQDKIIQVEEEAEILGEKDDSGYRQQSAADTVDVDGMSERSMEPREDTVGRVEIVEREEMGEREEMLEREINEVVVTGRNGDEERGEIIREEVMHEGGEGEDVKNDSGHGGHEEGGGGQGYVENGGREEERQYGVDGMDEEARRENRRGSKEEGQNGRGSKDGGGENGRGSKEGGGEKRRESKEGRGEKRRGSKEGGGENRRRSKEGGGENGRGGKKGGRQ